MSRASRISPPALPEIWQSGRHWLGLTWKHNSYWICVSYSETELRAQLQRGYFERGNALEIKEKTSENQILRAVLMWLGSGDWTVAKKDRYLLVRRLRPS